MLQSWEKLLSTSEPLVLRLKFIVTVELPYDQAECDFVQCKTTMRAFASRICSEFKQIELNWKKNCSSKCFMESGLLYNPTKKQTNLQVGCKLALQPCRNDDRSPIWKIQEDLWYLFSSEDKYKEFSLYQREDWLIDWNQLQLCQF